MPKNLTTLLLGEDRATIEQIISEYFAGQTGVPIGAIVPIASNLAGSYVVPITGNVDSNGFMYCDGSVIPDGMVMSGTIPDLTDGRFLRGSTEAGAIGGAETFTLATDNIPAHAHSIGDHTHTVSAHTHSIPSHSHTINHDHPSATTSSHGGHTHGYYRFVSGVTTAQFGGSVYWGHSWTATGSGGSHSHTFDVPSYSGSSGSWSGTSGSSGGGDTGLSGAGNTGSVGGGVAKSHIPKYVNVQYLIKVN